MNEPLDDLFLKWLYRQVADDRIKNRSKTYWNLLQQMYTKEFFWFVSNDDNRIEAGKKLRREFFQDEGIHDAPSSWADAACSMLELMVALSRQMAFDTGGEASFWFWELMGNLELDHYVDRGGSKWRENVNDILDRVIMRTYNPSGRGGLFPLKHPKEDQRRVELWYQMSAYILEL